jgi:hypothetical protein
MLTNGSHTLHVSADMSPTRAFDTLGFDWDFQVRVSGPPPPPPSGPAISLNGVTLTRPAKLVQT